MTEIMMFDCDAPGCSAFTSIDNAADWLVFICTYGMVGDQDDDDIYERTLHACSRVHMREAIRALADEATAGTVVP